MLDKFRNEPEILSGIVLRISNVGRDVATNLQMRTVPVISDVDGLIIEDNTEPLIRESKEESEWRSPRGNYLEPGEEANFRCRINIICEMEENYDSNTTPRLFGFYTGRLYRKGEKTFRFKLYIEYKNTLGESFEEEVLDFVVPIKGDTSLRLALKHGELYDDLKQKRRGLGMRQERMEKDTGQWG